MILPVEGAVFCFLILASKAIVTLSKAMAATRFQKFTSKPVSSHDFNPPHPSKNKVVVSSQLARFRISFYKTMLGFSKELILTVRALEINLEGVYLHQPLRTLWPLGHAK